MALACVAYGAAEGKRRLEEQRDAVAEEVIQAACSRGASANHNAFCFGMPGEEFHHADLSSFSAAFDLDSRERANE